MNAYKVERSAEEFDDFINECVEEVVIFGMHYQPAKVLREVDPIAYNCEFSDWESSQDEEWMCETCGEVHYSEEEAEACCNPVVDEDDE